MHDGKVGNELVIFVTAVWKPTQIEQETVNHSLDYWLKFMTNFAAGGFSDDVFIREEVLRIQSLSVSGIEHVAISPMYEPAAADGASFEDLDDSSVLDAEKAASVEMMLDTGHNTQHSDLSDNVHDQYEIIDEIQDDGQLGSDEVRDEVSKRTDQRDDATNVEKGLDKKNDSLQEMVDHCPMDFSVPHKATDF